MAEERIIGLHLSKKERRKIAFPKENIIFAVRFIYYLIKSFILVDLKVNRITYQDVGQMDMYLQMYDNMKKGPDDNPTIGIILCAETDSDVARYSTLAKNDQMFAAKYKLYLPDEEDLRREIEKQKELYLMAHPEEQNKKGL